MFVRVVRSAGISLKKKLLDPFIVKATLSYSVKNKLLYKDLFLAKCYKGRLVPQCERPQYKIAQLPDESSLPLLTNEEFLNLLLDVFVYRRLSGSEEFMNLLRKECFNRQSSFDNLSIFYCADILKKSDFYFDEYMQTLVRNLVFRWNDIILCKEDMLLFAYFLCSSNSSVMVPLIDKVERYFRENISIMSPREVGLMCHLFFSTNNRIKEFSTIKAMESYILANLRKNDKFYLTDLNNMIKVFRHAHHSNIKFFLHLGDLICSDLLSNSCSFTHLSNLAFSYASLNIRHDNLLNMVTNIFCNKLVDLECQSQGFPRLKDFSRLLWSRAFFCMEVSEELKFQVLKLLRSDPSHAYKFPEIFIEALTALATLGTYDKDMLKLAFSSNFIKFKLGRSLEQDYQMLLLRSAASVEDRFCMDLKTKKHLDNMIPSTTKRLNHDMTFRQGLFVTVNTLYSIFGDWSLFKVHFILDFSRIADIELHVDKQGKVQRLMDWQHNGKIIECLRSKQDKEHFSILKEVKNSSRAVSDSTQTEYENFHLKHGRTCFPKKICIKVLGQNQYSHNGFLPNGHCQLELRLIHKLGYEVYVIDPSTAKNLEEISLSEKIKLLAGIMSKCGVIIK